MTRADRAVGQQEDSGEPLLLLVTTDEELRDEIALIAAVIGAKLLCQPQWPKPDERPISPVGVLCSAETAAAAPQHEPVLLVGRESAELWEAAAGHPQLTPVPLPAAEAWLSEHLSGRITDQHRAPVIAVAAALGGAGATTMAYLCAAELAVQDRAALLLDACSGPGSGIQEMLATGLHTPGHTRGHDSVGRAAGGDLDWKLLGGTKGRLSAAHLRTAVPQWEGIAVLSGDAAVPVETVITAAEAGRRAFDAVIIDVGHRPNLVVGIAEHVDRLLLVTPLARRGVQAVQNLLTLLQSSGAELPVSLITNGQARGGWDSAAVQATTGLTVAADLAEQRWLRRSEELSEAYELLRTSRGASLAAALLQEAGVADAQ